jgi:hypothetical protein
MPVVRKQRVKKKKRAKVKRQKPKSVRERIRPVSEFNKGIKLLIYGRARTGKTRFAMTFRGRKLLIGTEDGTRSITKIKDAEFIQIESLSDFEEVIEILQTGDFQSATLDTAGGLQDMVLKDVLDLEDMPVQKSWGMAKQQDWGTCAVQTKEHLRRFLTLADQGPKIDIVIVAHERNFDTDSESELIFPTVGAALTPSVTGWLNANCDYICQTYLQEEVKQTHKSIGVGKRKRTKTIERKTGKIEYCLRIGPHPVYMTGFRVPHGVELPHHISDPHFDKLLPFISGEE